MVEPAEAINAYLAWREEKRRLKEEMDMADKAMAVLETYMLGVMLSRGENEIKTDLGTAYKQEQRRVTVGMRDDFLNFVLEHGATQFLTNHVSKEAVMEFVAEHNAPPPGVNITTFTVCNVRKA
jgi:hypothetical protein